MRITANRAIPEPYVLPLPPPLGRSWRSAVLILRKSAGRSLDLVDGATLSALADQIEAQLPKPKPTEPTGLGAVVRDRDGRRFVAVSLGFGRAPYRAWLRDDGDICDYQKIDAVDVLSSGAPG